MCIHNFCKGFQLLNTNFEQLLSNKIKIIDKAIKLPKYLKIDTYIKMMQFIKTCYILLFMLILPVSICFAQQDAQFTQYMYNTMVVNPAYAGSREMTSITVLHRSQWVGLDGAPKTQTLNINTPVSPSIGVGFSIVNDETGNGTNQDTYFDAAFSYSIETSDTGRLYFGLKAGAHLLDINFNKLKIYSKNPSSINQPNIDNKFSPNFGAGIYYKTNKYYVGLSVPNFLETQHFDNSGGENGSFLSKEVMNVYLITGFAFELNPEWYFKPAILAKAVSGAPFQLDISANFIKDQKFTIGAAYRWDAAISVLAGFQISERLMLGVAYDKETTQLGDIQFNGGSFEALLRYEFETRYTRALNSCKCF